MDNQLDTNDKIKAAAMEEFLKNGFQMASLRNIVKIAGVTTGAFYGYYKSKEELFESLVNDQYNHIMKMYIDTQNEFKQLDTDTMQSSMGKVSGDCMEDMLDYMYDNVNEFRLILMCSKGTKYENMIHEMSDIEVQATHDFVNAMQADGKAIKSVDPMLEHMLVSGMFSAFFELLIHKDDIKEAKLYLHQLRSFYTAGWREIFEIEL